MKKLLLLLLIVIITIILVPQNNNKQNKEQNYTKNPTTEFIYCGEIITRDRLNIPYKTAKLCKKE